LLHSALWLRAAFEDLTHSGLMARADAVVGANHGLALGAAFDLNAPIRCARAHVECGGHAAALLVSTRWRAAAWPPHSRSRAPGRRPSGRRDAGATRPVVAEEARSALHDLDDRFVDRVLGWAMRRFGDEADPDALEWSFPEVGEGGVELLLPWAVYHHTVDGLPPFEWYARENEPMLSRREREWIEAQRRSWLSIWEVRESVPGKSMLLADLLTGEQRLVQEAGASRVLAVRDAILGRVAALGGESIVAGRHWRSLPPLEVAKVIGRLRRRLRAKLPLGVERLCEEDTVHALIDRVEAQAIDRAHRIGQSRKIVAYRLVARLARAGNFKRRTVFAGLLAHGISDGGALESSTMNRSEIVHSDPDILGGTPVFVGTRVPVRSLLVYLEKGETLEEFLDNFPTVRREQAVAFLEEAGRALLAQIA